MPNYTSIKRFTVWRIGVFLVLLLMLPTLSVQAEILTVDSVGNVGIYNSLAVVNGNPAISYSDITNGDLRYVRALNANGTAWGTPITVDSAGTVGYWTSLAVVNGNPAIAYLDVTNGDLRYVRANDANGTTWGTPITVDAVGFVGGYASLAVINGNPAIAYHDTTNFDLRYVRATDANGTTWGAPLTLDSVGIVGDFPDLMMINGLPAIAYTDFGNGDLRYIRATDVNGTAWGTPLIVDAPPGTVVGWSLSMRIINGNPAVAHYDLTNYNLRYVRATDASGTAWGTPLVVDASGEVDPGDVSLNSVNGSPAISYYVGGGLSNPGSINELRFVRATDADGAAWGAPIAVDADGGGDSSLVIVNGNPAVSYQGVSGADLRYARACDANGTSWLLTCQIITLTFDSPTSSSPEATGIGNVLRVTTDDGNPTTIPVTVTVSVTGGTATAADYNLTGTITIPAGTASNSLVSIASGITIVNDGALEPDETVQLTLSAPVWAVLGAQTTHTHTIQNDDVATATFTPTPTETPVPPGGSPGAAATAAANPLIAVFDPAISKLGFLQPGQLGAQGEEIEWVVSVSNTGGAAGSNVLVTDTLRPELSILRVNAPGGTVNISGQTVSVTYATLAAGQAVQFSIFTRVTNGATVNNTACVEAAGIASECASATPVTTLPATGEMPAWRTPLLLLLIVSAGAAVLLRSRRRQPDQN